MLRRRSESLLLASLMTALGASACDHHVQSPTPAVRSVMPNLVCTEQITTTIALSGDHLTPLPIRTLGGFDGGQQPQTLQLPAIFLTEAFSLSGMMVTGADAGPDGGYQIFDDYDHPVGSHVSWTSESLMGFDIYPELHLQPGVYDVVVQNPDGQRAVLHNGIAAVPPPHITGVMPPEICVAQGPVTVTLDGTGFLEVGTMTPTVTITPQGGGMGKTYTPTLSGCGSIAMNVRMDLQSCTTATINIPAGDLMPGTYTVSIENPMPANCHSTDAITLVVAPPPHVSAVSPMTICQGGGTLDVTGMNFASGATVTLGTSTAGSVNVMSPTMLSATFGGGSTMFTPGMHYDLTVTNADGCHDTLANAVTAVAGPVLFFVDPPVVYNGITTRVTMYSTSITAPLVSVTMQMAGGSPITLTAMIDPMHAHRILATVPAGTPPGDYDITVTDSSGCPATLPHGLHVTGMATLMITSINPPFGWQNGTTAVTITAAGGLMPTPRAYLNPHTPSAGTIATALSSVAFESPTTLTAIVPQGLDPASNPYDLIIVNPDGSVGVLTMPDAALYRSEANPPPVIDSISPVAVPNTGPPPVTITGANFRMPMVTFTCETDVATGTTMDFPATVSMSTATSIVITNPPVTTLTAPTLCTIKVTDDDGSFATFVALAITNPSGNLSVSAAGPTLMTARRGAALMGADATRAAHFLYVVGGDNGMSSGALDSVEFIQTNERGYSGAWATQRYHLAHPRTLMGYASLGRYLYVVGGNDGTAPVGTVERAMVLDPLQSPQITDVDIVPGMGTGLTGGIWVYRVSANMPATDPDNPSGETLPSDVFPIQIPDITQRLQVTLVWSAVPGASGYNIYRTPMAGMSAGQEQLLATVSGGSTLTFTDNGGTTMSGTPLPLGSTGTWRTLAALGGPRESNAAVFGTDPTMANHVYLYSTFGTSMTGALNTYEFLPITVDATTGQQTPAAAWTPGGTMSSAARSQHYAYSATHANASFVAAGTNYIYVGGGTSNGTTVIMNLDSATVQTGGLLSAWAATGATIRSFGGGYTLAANYLYSFGDQMPSDAIFAGQISSTAPPAIVNFNNNGNRLTTARYLPGTALQGAYIFLAGGSTAGHNGASNTVEAMIW